MTILPASARPDGGSRPIPHLVVAAVGGYLLVYAGWLLLFAGDGATKSWIGGLSYVPIAAFVAIQAQGAARRTAAVPRKARGWQLIGAAVIAYAAGTEAQTLYEVNGGLPDASLADVGYLGFYPLFLGGALLFPRGRRSVRGSRPALDALIFGLGAAVIVWYLVLGPASTRDNGTTLETLVTFAYPAGDLVLVAAMALLLLQPHPLDLRRPLSLLGVAAVLYLAGDLLWATSSTYSSGDVLDLFWTLAAANIGLAAASQPTVQAIRPLDAPAFPQVRVRHVSVLPYATALAVFVLLLVSQREEAFFPELGLTVAAVGLAVLVLARQGLVQRDLSRILEQLESAHEELAALATTDPLTGLPNHRALVLAIDKELERSRRFERSCGLVFFDIDHFKSLNDTHGHAAGDDVLSELAGVVRGSLRTMDTVGRWGGEEFVVVLPESEPGEALAAAERLRVAVADHVFSPGDGSHLTISLGVATFPADGGTRGDLLTAADQAMYTAKRLGRNQTFSADNPAVMAFPGDLVGADHDEGALLAAVDALAMLVDARDRGTGRHSETVSLVAERVALALGCTPAEARQVRLAAKLHDIGKVAVADAILRKPGRLTPEEWDLMRRHPVIGADVVGRIGRLAELAPIIRQHHERFDGGGYPDGLAGEEIQLAARIVGVADAFDAMISERSYRTRMDLAQARAELRRCAGTQFDPEVVAVLERLIDDEGPRLLARAGGADAAPTTPAPTPS